MTFWRILVPLTWPAIAAVFVYFFITAMSVFEAPAILGLPNGIFVLSSAIFEPVGDHRGDHSRLLDRCAQPLCLPRHARHSGVFVAGDTQYRFSSDVALPFLDHPEHASDLRDDCHPNPRQRHQLS